MKNYQSLCYLFLSYVLLTLLWSFVFGYQITFVLLAQCYTIGIIIFPGLILAFLIYPAEEVEKVTAMATILSLGLMLGDYLAHIKTGLPWGGLYVLLYGYVFCFCFTKHSAHFKKHFLKFFLSCSEKNILSAFAICLVCVLIFILYTLPRPAPESFFSDGFSVYYPDFLWHAGNVASLTETFPPISKNLSYPVEIRYHFLVHILAGHLAKLTHIPPSLAFLNYVFIPISFLIGVLTAAFSKTFKFGSLVFLLLALNLCAHLGFISESHFFSIILILAVVIVLGPDFRVSTLPFKNVALIGLGAGLALLAKGPVGLPLVTSLCLFALSDRKILCRQEFKNIIAKTALIGIVWVGFYLYFFSESVMGSDRSIDINRTIPRHYVGYNFDILKDLKIVLHNLSQSYFKVLVLGPLIKIAIGIFSAFALLASFVFYLEYLALGFASVALLPKYRRVLLFFVVLAFVSLLSFKAFDFRSAEAWFLRVAEVAMVIPFVFLLHYILLKGRKNGRSISFLTVVILTALSLVPITVKEKDFYNEVFLSLVDRIQNSNLRSMHPSRLQLTPDLYEALVHIRQHTDKKSIIIHNIGIANNMFRAFPSYIVSGFSERTSFLESAGFTLGLKSKYYLENISIIKKRLEETSLESVNSPVVAEGIRTVLKNYSDIKNIFGSNPDQEILKKLLGKNFLLLGQNIEMDRVKNLELGQELKIVFRNKKYSVIQL